MTPPLIIGFDTSGAWCRGALLRGDQVLASFDEPMTKGQGEALMPLLETLLGEAGMGWPDLSAIGVGTGPGNFTGIRISISAARGLALALGVPAIGVSRFDAMALDGPVLPVVVPALRGQVWVKSAEAAPMLCDHPPADAIGDALTAPRHPPAIAIAHLARARLGTPQPRPAPLYLRDADAAPPTGKPPALIE